VDEIFSRTDTTGSSTFLTDALGSTAALTDPKGNIQTQYAYAPFGNTTVSGLPSTNSLQFTGRENDRTGLYYYRDRYYGPALGRFTSEDRLRFTGGGTDYYVYNGNNPITLTDPFGTISLFPPGWLANPENVALLGKLAGEGVSPLATTAAPAGPGTGVSGLATTGVDPLAATVPDLAADVSPLAAEVAAPEAIAGTTSGLGSNITFQFLNYSQFAPEVEAARAAQAAAGEAAGGIGGSAFVAGVAVGAVVAALWASYSFHAAACQFR
jgi:RHS repeat-associated protein